MKSFLFVFCVICSMSLASAQSVQTQFYQAYLENDMEAWEKGIAELSRAYEQGNDASLLLQMAKGAYGAVNTSFALEDMDAAATWADKAEEYCELFLEANPKNAEGKALLAGIYGMQIGLKPIRGMRLGPKSGRLLSEAIAADKNCALAYYQLGMSAFNTPEQWGGSVEKAVEHLTVAKDLFEQAQTKENWIYLSNLAWLGISQSKLNHYEAAKVSYQQALATEPNFGWVKMQLLPEVEGKLGGK